MSECIWEKVRETPGGKAEYEYRCPHTGRVEGVITEVEKGRSFHVYRGSMDFLGVENTLEEAKRKVERA